MREKTSRFLGGILLVSGTTIGAGMLAVPALTAFGGFFPSLVLFLFIWGLMLTSALFFLDVNLAVRGEPNLISMSGKTLGGWGKAVTWVAYLLLLYSLTAAYIAGSAPLFVNAINYLTGYSIPSWMALFVLPVVFGGFVYLGTRGVDYVNRLLMFGLVISYILLVIFIPRHVEEGLLLHWDFPAIGIAIPIVVTSFGYHIIIPSLTTYMKHDAKLLRLTIIIGSVIPLLVYFFWQILVLGTVPLELLTDSYTKGESVTIHLSKILNNTWIGLAAQFFAFFAIVTSFIGVALSLADFLTDGFKIKKTWEGRLVACLLTFIPPLVFVFTYERGFYLALQYAGAFVAILLIFLPAAMAWKLKEHPFYHSARGRLVLLLVILLSLGILVVDVLEEQGILSRLIKNYVPTENRS